MKLYYSPAACSLSPHIALAASGLPYTLERVNLRDHKTASGVEYASINAKGYVPALELDDGELLTEGPAIVQYVADLAPTTGLAPANGTMARYRLQEWLTYIGTELHKQYSPLFEKTASDERKELHRANIRRRLQFIEDRLGDAFLMGDTYTVADGYLWVTQYWNRWVGLDLTAFPKLAAWYARVEALPAVKQALREEHLLKE